MRRSAPVLSLAFCIVYLVIAVLITRGASSKGMCGEGDLLPPCNMFTFAVAVYGVIAIGAVTTLLTLAAVFFRRRVPQLLKTGSILYLVALLSLVLPVMLAGNRLGGAILLMMVLPFSLLLLAAASICFVLWLGRAVNHSRIDP